MATIDSLLEVGYSRTTTAEIVRRSGVGRGTYLHHFATLEETMVSAISYLRTMRVREIERAASGLASGDRSQRLLNLIYRTAYGDLFFVQLEFFNAARTDKKIRQACKNSSAETAIVLSKTFEDFYGAEAMKNARLRDLLEAALDVMRGLSLMSIVRGAAVSRQIWEAIGPTLAHLIEDCVAQHAAGAIAKPNGNARKVKSR